MADAFTIELAVKTYDIIIYLKRAFKFSGSSVRPA